MNSQDLRTAADALYDAAHGGPFIMPLRQKWPDMAVDDAYCIQRLNTDRRRDEGRRLVGCKIGMTSVAVQTQLGVAQPDFGVLLDDMAFGDAEPIPMTVLTQPRIEAEVAFVLGKDLNMINPGPLDVLRAIEFALPALEIVGSRIAQWDIGITDTIADNASASAFVLGTCPRGVSEFDLRLCSMAIDRNGVRVSTGSGAACLGNPINAVVWLARTMSTLGTPLHAGDLVLSGALGPMVPVLPGDVFEAVISGLGSLSAIFEVDAAS
jgi:2-keto-4-pentenoate hydratase